MRPLRRLWNIGFLTGSSAVARLMFFSTTIFIYKALSLDEAGTFGYLYAASTTVALLTELGLRGYIIREIARRKEEPQETSRLYSTAMTTRLVAFPVQLLMTIFAASIAHYQSNFFAAGLLCLAAWSESASLLTKSAFRAHERMGWEAVTSITAKTSLAVMAAWLYFHHALTLNAICITMAATSFSELLVVLAVAEIDFRLLFRPFPLKGRDMSQMMRASSFFAVLSFVGILYFRVGVLTLGLIGDNHSANVAVYTLAGRIPEGLAFFPVAVVNALIPYLSTNSHDSEGVSSTFNALVKLLGLSGIAASSVLVLCAHQVIIMIGKAEYLPHIGVFQVYGLTVITAYIQYIFANQLICIDREKQVARRFIICLILNIILSLGLSWRYGAIGTAFALLTCEFTGILLDSTLLWKLGHKIAPETLKSFAVMVAAVGIVYAVSWKLQGLPLLFLVAGTAGLVLMGYSWGEWKRGRRQTA